MVDINNECERIADIANNNIKDFHYGAMASYVFLNTFSPAGYRLIIMRDCGKYGLGTTFGKDIPSTHQIKKATKQNIKQCEKARNKK